ncbi:MAG: uroporphyrinogen-III synthase [Pseudomonadota bacterium]
MSTVLLSRPANRADRLIETLQGYGHRVINAPVTAIEAVPAPTLPSLRMISGTIFSSAAAVPYVPQALKQAAQARPALAVGPVTAEALERDGWQSVTHFGGEMPALLAFLAEQPKDAPWLYPCGAQLAHAPEDMAERSGATIAAITVYEARTLGPWPPSLLDRLRAAQIDITLFLSVRTARLFCDQVAQAGLWPMGMPGAAGCISGAVAEALDPLRYKEIIVSQEKTTSSLVAALGLS